MRPDRPGLPGEQMIRRAAIGFAVAFVVLAVLSAELALRQVHAKKDAEVIQGMKLLLSPLYVFVGASGSEGVHRTEEFSVRLRANHKAFGSHNLGADESVGVAFLGGSSPLPSNLGWGGVLTPFLMTARQRVTGPLYYLVDGYLRSHGRQIVFESFRDWLSRNS